LWLHSLKVAQLLRSAACLHTNQSRSYLNHLVSTNSYLNYYSFLPPHASISFNLFKVLNCKADLNQKGHLHFNSSRPTLVTSYGMSTQSVISLQLYGINEYPFIAHTNILLHTQL